MMLLSIRCCFRAGITQIDGRHTSRDLGLISFALIGKHDYRELVVHESHQHGLEARHVGTGVTDQAMTSELANYPAEAINGIRAIIEFGGSPHLIQGALFENFV